MYRQFTDLDIRTREPVETKQDEVVTTLRRAADVIRERGWAKHTQCDARGRVCFVGAISIAEYGVPFQPMMVGGCDLYETIGKPPGFEFWSDWNNAPGRTASEVIAALDGVADARQAALSFPAGMRGK